MPGLSIGSCRPLLLPVLCPWRLCQDLYEAWIHWTIGGATVAGGLILLDPWRGSSDQQRLLYDVLQLSLLAGVQHRSALWLDDVFNTHEESCICAIQPVSWFLLHSPCLGTVWQDAFNTGPEERDLGGGWNAGLPNSEEFCCRRSRLVPFWQESPFCCQPHMTQDT